MSRRSFPIVLICALCLPGVVRALGLGDIRVNSALNEPLAAQIQILGANADELRGLQANVAGRETFQHIGADRPGFLSSASFTVGTDEQGHPVLNVRSSEAFTEPVVSLVIDLRWGTGELIREFSLLLDPAVSKHWNAEIPPAPAVNPEASSVAYEAIRVKHAAAPAIAKLPPEGRGQYKVSAGDTLRAIAMRIGAHAPSDVQRTMIAIFRANPPAFDGNINRLHLGARLDMPASADIAAIGAEEAASEVRAQHATWRMNAKPVPAAPIETKSRETAATVALTSRVQDLERELTGINEQIAAKAAAIRALQARAVERAAAKPQPQILVSKPTQNVAPARSGQGRIAPIAMSVALLITCAALFRKRPAPILERTAEVMPPGVAPISDPQSAPSAAANESTPGAAPDAPRVEMDSPLPHAAGDTRETRSTTESSTEMLERSFEDSMISDAQTLEPDLHTMIMDARTSFPPPVDSTTLDYDLNALDFDSTAQHVEMPSTLNDRAVVSERRTNVADVLKNAIERDPTRRDLVMKLLETYHQEASTNRLAFLDVVRKLSGQRDSLSREDWMKITRMGREIASDDPLFADSEDATTANCA
jgi:pilus assembly protein FimV